METFSIATIPPTDPPQTSPPWPLLNCIHMYTIILLTQSQIFILWMNVDMARQLFFNVKLEMKKKSYNIAHMLTLYEP